MDAGSLALAWIVGVAGPTLSALSAATVARTADAQGLDAFVTATGRCPDRVEHCIGLALHVVAVDGEPVRDPGWVGAQVAEANRLFAPIGVGFEVASVETEPAERADMVTREDRDLLGRAGHSLGVIHVYVVRSLADVDIPGAFIKGVHWRDRANTRRRWIILSASASSLVLSHELGHFFGLPHSKHPESLMNKSPHMNPPWWERSFVESEQRRMAQHRDRMLADGTLRSRSRRARVAGG